MDLKSSFADISDNSTTYDGSSKSALRIISFASSVFREPTPSNKSDNDQSSSVAMKVSVTFIFICTNISGFYKNKKPKNFSGHLNTKIHFITLMYSANLLN